MPTVSRRFGPRRLRAALPIALLLAAIGAAEAAGDRWFAFDGPKPVVCAQAVLAIDGSGSTEQNAFSREVVALERAFEDPRLQEAIQNCLPCSFAFTAMTWSGPSQ